MPGRGVHRGVYSSLLDHPDFQALPPQARHVFLTLRLSKQVGPAAIFVCYREVLAQQTGLPVRRVRRCLEVLEQAGWIETEGRIVWIINGLRHDPTMRIRNPKHRFAVLRALEEVPRGTKILAKYRDYYRLPDSLSDSQSRSGPPNTEYRDTSPNTDLACSSGKGSDAVEDSDAGVTPSPETPDEQLAQIKREVAKLSKRLGWR